MARTRRRGEGSSLPPVEGRERSAILNQLLLAAVVLLSTILVVLLGQYTEMTGLVVALALIAVATVAALLVPWRRVPRSLSMLVPAVDIVAIALLREASPASGQGLLLAFPVMWIAWSFGRIATSVATLLTILLYWASIVLGDGAVLTASAMLLPVTLTALATITQVMSQRISAQRALLDKQSRFLERAVERAHRHEDTMSEVLDAVDFGVIRIAADGSLVVSNEAQSRLHQHRERVAYAADGVTPLDPDQLPLVRVGRGETFEGELVWYGEPGSDRVALSVTARRLTGTRGGEAGTIVVSRDVTAEELALRAREDLVASVSHELRTPLTSIVGYLDLVLDDDGLPASATRSLEIAQRNAERLLELIGDILAASAAPRGDAGLRIAPRRCDLAEIVGAAIESAAPRAAERDIAFDGGGVEPAMVEADPLRIRQVVDNLLSNAIKYHRDGGRVDVGCTIDGGSAWIVVRDDGPGIGEQELPRLFDRFFRADAVRNTSIHGSGLGLAISRDIVRAHGGEITVRSTVGEGSTFLVRLPVEQAAEADATESGAQSR